MTMELVDRLRSALSDEFADGPRICTLATVDEGGEPAARSVVCRKIDHRGALYFASDARSDKNAQAGRGGAVVFWLPGRREQVRLRGPMKVFGAGDLLALREALWRELSPATRAMFLWPPPGWPRTDDADAFVRQVDASVAVAPAFEVLVLEPDRIEWLDLKPHPHDRRRWEMESGWAEQRLNP